MKFSKIILFTNCLLWAGVAGAQENISQTDIQNELLRASLSKAGTTQAADPKSITEADLDKANKKLLAAEARLLEKAQSGIVSPALPKMNDNSEVKEQEPVKIEIKEKDIQPPAPVAVIEPKSEPSSLDLNKVIAAIDKTKVEPDQVKEPAAKLDAKPAVTPGSIEELKQKNIQLEKSLTEAQAKSNDLLKELDDTRNRLMIAETQVERLSSIIDSGGKSRGTAAATRPSDMSSAQMLSRSKPAERPVNRNPAPAPQSDMQIAVVTADKVHLRTGPGKDNSPLMAVTKGTRLAVEMKNGEWYRVIAPTGARAWVSEDVISFSTASKIKAASQGQVMGFNGSADNDNFEISKP